MFRELLKELLESYNKVEEPIYEHKELIEGTQDILSEASFSKAHIDALKKAYGGIKKINPDSEAYKKLVAMLNGLPDNQLKTLAKADVPFVSALARNRVISRGLKLESLDEVSRLGLLNALSVGEKSLLRKIDDKWSFVNFDLNRGSDEDMYKAVFNLKGRGYIETGKTIDNYPLKKIQIKKTKKGLDIVESKSEYTVSHKTFSSAVQHARDVAEKRGFQVDDDDWDRKVALGPKKPSSGKTNTYSIELMKNGKSVKQKLQMQVYYDEGRYELNMYIQ